jgi:hypothetical protein
MVRRVVRWPLGAMMNEQNEAPLRDSAGRPVMENAEHGR